MSTTVAGCSTPAARNASAQRSCGSRPGPGSGGLVSQKAVPATASSAPSAASKAAWMRARSVRSVFRARQSRRFRCLAAIWLGAEPRSIMKWTHSSMPTPSCAGARPKSISANRRRTTSQSSSRSSGLRGPALSSARVLIWWKRSIRVRWPRPPASTVCWKCMRSCARQPCGPAPLLCSRLALFVHDDGDPSGKKAGRLAEPARDRTERVDRAERGEACGILGEACGMRKETDGHGDEGAPGLASGASSKAGIQALSPCSAARLSLSRAPSDRVEEGQLLSLHTDTSGCAAAA
mmetsp:Transcript_66619/g.174651  ORF Transcript_66619/g.174651 Transcript_66619/m.174651 type:complete len:293 (-) Transcript_66619:131-1009(-)